MLEISLSIFLASSFASGSILFHNIPVPYWRECRFGHHFGTRGRVIDIFGCGSCRRFMVRLRFLFAALICLRASSDPSLPMAIFVRHAVPPSITKNDADSLQDPSSDTGQTHSSSKPPRPSGQYTTPKPMSEKQSNIKHGHATSRLRIRSLP